MENSDIIKILVLVIVVGLAIYLLGNNNSKDPINNEGSLSLNTAHSTLDPDRTVDDDVLDSIEDDDRSNNSEESSVIRKKLTTRDSAKSGKWKSSSYNSGQRGGKADLDRFFEEGPAKDLNKNGFVGNDEGNGNLASYIPGVKRKLSTEDKFNAKELLPSEVNKEWFDDPQTTSIKNSHMLNIYRPIGVNTIMTSLKNPSHDIRGTPPNPRYVVSPWMQSSYEPDLNLKNGALCA